LQELSDETPTSERWLANLNPLAQRAGASPYWNAISRVFRIGHTPGFMRSIVKARRADRQTSAQPGRAGSSTVVIPSAVGAALVILRETSRIQFLHLDAHLKSVKRYNSPQGSRNDSRQGSGVLATRFDRPGLTLATRHDPPIEHRLATSSNVPVELGLATSHVGSAPLDSSGRMGTGRSAARPAHRLHSYDPKHVFG
jgi:hypothetical protein